ncbi:MAG: hypothetical protein B0D88_06930, partial [Candidatus Sedimenticola endophacoides]
ENGFGKRTPVEQFPVKGRGGMGVISIKTSERNGAQVGAVLVDENEEIMLISDGGTLVRTPVDDISLMGRDTQGVTVIRLTNGEKLVGMARIESLANEDEGLDDAEGDTVE